MSCYYNENDPYAAQWLRNLIAAGHIAAGDVDERSIVGLPSRMAVFSAFGNAIVAPLAAEFIRAVMP